MDICLLRYRDSQIGLRRKETAYFIYEGCTENAEGEKWGQMGERQHKRCKRQMWAERKVKLNYVENRT